MTGDMIVEPGLSAGQARQQRNLATLRVLLARDYHTLLMGEGRASKSVPLVQQNSAFKKIIGKKSAKLKKNPSKKVTV